MSKFFINRPIFAWVIAIFIMFFGMLAIRFLPIAQYPTIAPPQVVISGVYRGANSTTVESSVTQVIEQQLKGLDGFRYMSATSDSSGAVSITVTFDQGTDPDIAQVQVQNKVQQALPSLPAVVQQQGLVVKKTAGSFLLVIGVYDDSDTMALSDISDYIATNVEDGLSRVEGVGDLQLFGSQNAMRIWLDPSKLNNYKLTPMDVSAAISAQNAQVALGQLGSAPSAENQQFNVVVNAQSLLQTAEQFENIFLTVLPDGSRVLLKDVARVEKQGESFAFLSSYNGKNASGMAVSLATGANALATAERVKSYMEDAQKSFPPGLKVVYPYDTTPFVKISLEHVVHTLVEAIVLVFVVMYFFLRNFRATIIPTLAIPVVLLGAFALLYTFGFIINTLTMFAMILAIGLLVDDAIVVVENVERIMSEEGLSPKEAALKSMDQITGALVGIGIVLSAVFVPMAFLGGSVGIIYQQFSITIIISMGLSVLTAIFFTPALCATILKKHEEHGHKSSGILSFLTFPVRCLNYLVDKFNLGFDWTNRNYEKNINKVVRKPKRYMMLFFVILALLYVGFNRLPTAFLPDEDQGIMFAISLEPNGTSLSSTDENLAKLRKHFLEDEKDSVNSFFSVAGFSFFGAGENTGMAFISLKPWDERTRDDQSVEAIQARAMQFAATFKDTMVITLMPPPITELGNATGFEFQLQDTAALGHATLMQSMFMLMGAVQQEPSIAELTPMGLMDNDQLRLNIDYEKAQSLGVSIESINNTLAIAWGSMYVNDFMDKDRIKKVIMQGEIDSRMQLTDINKWYVRNTTGEMVPFSSFSSYKWETGSPRLERFNGFPSRVLNGSPASGFSTGQAMDAIERIVQEQLPEGIEVSWSGLSYEEKAAGAGKLSLYAIAVMVVFLSLAALYESWNIPISVVLVVPLGVIGAVIAAWLSDYSNDVYFQVGLLTTIGLTAKNAILIVEFANDAYKSGVDLIEATVHACHMRLRPIIMTSIAFGLGVLPLAISSGAGHNAQNIVGRVVMGGMIGGTVLVLLFVPIFYIGVMRLFGYPMKHAKETNV